MTGSRQTLISAEALSFSSLQQKDRFSVSLSYANQYNPVQRLFRLSRQLARTQTALEKYKSRENLGQDEAAVELIEKALTDEGLLE